MVVTVGDIPAGKSNIDISLKAQEGRDVDIQLFDGDTKIILGIPREHGLMHGPSQETIQYDGLQITYSGYNGRNGDWGQEDIHLGYTEPNPHHESIRLPVGLCGRGLRLGPRARRR